MLPAVDSRMETLCLVGMGIEVARSERDAIKPA